MEFEVPLPPDFMQWLFGESCAKATSPGLALVSDPGAQRGSRLPAFAEALLGSFLLPIS